MKLLITGGDGQLGREFSDLSNNATIIISTNRHQIDITDINSVRKGINLYKPDAIINAAAYTAVDKAESEIEDAYSVNSNGVENLAIVAEEHKIPLLHVSTDYVFSGDKARGESYSENDPCLPLSVYGKSKLEGEERAMAHCKNTLILRTSWVFGRFGNNFPKTMLRLAKEHNALRIVDDQVGCPTYSTDIAKVLILAASQLTNHTLAPGIYHFSSSTSCTWYEFADFLLDAFQNHNLTIKPALTPISTSEYPTAAKRPSNSILNCEKIKKSLNIELPDWKQGIYAMAEYIKTHSSDV